MWVIAMNNWTSVLLLCLVQAAWAPCSVAEQLTVVPAETANKQSYITNKGINWYTSLEQAEAEAKKQGKLVLWLHMLGTMDGAT